MKVSVKCVGDVGYEIADFDQGTLQDLLDALNQDDVRTVVLALDGDTMVYIVKTQIVSVEID